MDNKTKGKFMTGLFGGILLMLILQFAIFNTLTADISAHKYQLLLFTPFALMVAMSVALFWLLERSGSEDSS